MAVFNGSFLSAELGRQTAVTVILPHDTKEAPPPGYPVMYFLHGKGDDNNTALYRSGLEKYANERGLCVVLPDIGLSYCADMACGGQYFAYLTHELPELINSLFKISLRREDTFIAGVSMGGYGALKCAFLKPELYGGCIALSPTADIVMEMNDDCQKGCTAPWKAILGESLRINNELDLYHILDDGGMIMTVTPKIYFACGRKDDMYNACIRLKDSLDRKRIDYTFEQADADHEWSFWDVAMQRGLDAVVGKKLPDYTAPRAPEPSGYGYGEQGYPAAAPASQGYGYGAGSYPAGGYGAQAPQTAYPSQGAYPSQTPQSPYPSQGAYPSQTPQSPYPSQGAYPSQTPQSPYPSQGAYPSQTPQPPYPSQGSQTGYGAQSGYGYSQQTQQSPQTGYSTSWQDGEQ